MARIALWITCVECGTAFDTGIRMSRPDFERATLASNYHRCPACGANGTYSKASYRLEEDAARRPER